jgi:LuxR family maltose regulon positive regulatory protein
MAANPQAVGTWSAAPLTKFRAPRVRRDAIARPALLERVLASVASQPLTLICAPGGFGKTSLLAQLASQSPSDTPLLWIAIDEDDNDRHRLLTTLVRAVEPLNLAWDASPSTLLRNAAGSASQGRAALAGFVNALCTASLSPRRSLAARRWRQATGARRQQEIGAPACPVSGRSL